MNADFSFPHPVLGLNDDIEGEFNVDLSVRRDPESREIIFLFNKLEVTNEYIDSFLDSEKAGPFVKIYCSSTLRTWTFYNKVEMRINEDEIFNYVDIDVRILSLVDNMEYYHETFNEQFDGQKFVINKYDIISVLEKERVPLPKENEKLGLGNIFKFRSHKDDEKPIEINVNNDEFIEITYPLVNGDSPSTYFFKHYPWTAYNILILPALEEAFRFIENDERTASQYRWFNVIDKLLPKDERTGVHFIDAQNLLNDELPIIKSYKELSNN